MLSAVACSSGNEPGDGAPSGSQAATATADGPFCDAFAAIRADLRAGDGTVDTEAECDARLERTRRLTEVAPDEVRDAAETYDRLVHARRDFAARFGFRSVADLPEAERAAFIEEHRDDQAKAAPLITLAVSTCGTG